MGCRMVQLYWWAFVRYFVELVFFSATARHFVVVPTVDVAEGMWNK